MEKKLVVFSAQVAGGLPPVHNRVSPIFQALPLAAWSERRLKGPDSTLPVRAFSCNANSLGVFMNHSLVAFFSLLAGVMLFAVPAKAAPGLPSQPSSVLFYPDEAQINVNEELAQTRFKEGRRVTLIVPANVDESTFFAKVEGNQIAGVFWHEEESNLPVNPLPGGAGGQVSNRPIMPLDPQEEPSLERRALLAAYLDLKSEETKVNGRLQAAESRHTMWTRNNSGEKGLSPADALNMDKALAEKLPQLIEDIEKNRALLSGLIQKRAKAEFELRRYDQQHRTREVDVLLRNPATGSVKIQYSYIVPAAYSSSYRVSALPGEETVGIDQQATLTQQSGMTWKDVEVMLSTTRRNTRLAPSDLYSWYINIHEKEADSRYARGANKMSAEVSASAPLEPMMADEVATSSGMLEQEELSTFRLWKLGKRTLESDTPLVVDLAQDTYKAEFYYTLRPSVDPRGYLTAKLTFPEPIELAAGKAQFLVDETAIGWQNFSLEGKESYIFFGLDPQVSVTMRNLERVEGQQGFISKEQTLTWHWEFIVKNNRSRDINIRLEDSMPHLGNKDIKLEVVSTPKPAEKPDERAKSERVYTWLTTLKPGEEYKVDHKVSITAPKDKELQPGRW